MEADDLKRRLWHCRRSQGWLADELKVRPSTINRWANGAMPIPPARDEQIRELLPLAEVEA